MHNDKKENLVVKANGLLLRDVGRIAIVLVWICVACLLGWLSERNKLWRAGPTS